MSDAVGLSRFGDNFILRMKDCQVLVSALLS